MAVDRKTFAEAWGLFRMLKSPLGNSLLRKRLGSKQSRRWSLETARIDGYWQEVVTKQVLGQTDSDLELVEEDEQVDGEVEQPHEDVLVQIVWVEPRVERLRIVAEVVS